MAGADDRAQEDRVRLAVEHAQREREETDQAAAETDQMLADADRAGAEMDQLASGVDKELARRDQYAADRDQAAADWERLHVEQTAAAREALAISRSEREATARERAASAADRERTSAMRAATAARRDEIARRRDLTAARRDQLAEARDAAAAVRDRAAEARHRRMQAGDAPEWRALRALHEEAAAERAQAAAERAAAAADRRAAAADREQAATDRRLGGLDELTGVYRRGAGELAIGKEIDRARRSARPLTVVMFDVDDLKSVNDRHGHDAGDALLRSVAMTIVAALRAYDVTVRWGGDEFLCALYDATTEVAIQRTAQIAAALGALNPPVSVSAGYAELSAADTFSSVIARADRGLTRMKPSRTD